MILLLVGRAQGVLRRGGLRDGLRDGMGDGMGGGLSIDGDTALEETGRGSPEQALFGATRRWLFRGDNADGRSVAVLQVGLTLALRAMQRGGGQLGGFLTLRWPLMRGWWLR